MHGVHVGQLLLLVPERRALEQHAHRLGREREGARGDFGLFDDAVNEVVALVASEARAESARFLARLPDAPAGTKGITLFLVPKRLVDDDGTVGELNGVATSRIEHKMGCHGSPTCASSCRYRGRPVSRPRLGGVPGWIP